MPRPLLRRLGHLWPRVHGQKTDSNSIRKTMDGLDPHSSLGPQTPAWFRAETEINADSGEVPSRVAQCPTLG